MYNDIIKLLNLEQFNLNILNLSTAKVDNVIYCYITLQAEITPCPVCGGFESSVHDYRDKRLIHSISTNNPCLLIYYARRFKCKYCKKVFYEHNPFTVKNSQTSTFTRTAILNELRSHTSTFTSVAQHFMVNKRTVINIFDDYVYCRRKQLPRVLCIDEIYKGKHASQKYACVFLNWENNQIIEVFSSRHKYNLQRELTLIPQEEREKVELVIIDMWDTYRDISKYYFKNAKIAVDSFHIIKHLNNAMISIRIKIMRKYYKHVSDLEFNDKYYYMLKKFHYFFVKDFDKIYDGPIRVNKFKTKWNKHTIRDYLLSIDKDLKYAYYLKEKYREFNLTTRYEKCGDELDELIEEFLNSHLEEFREFGKMINRWKPYIKNSFIRINGRRISNGPIEGVNSRIKTILKNANGYINFGRLRNKIMFSINKNEPILNKKMEYKK